MIVEIDDASPVPPYEQLRAAIASHIATGALTPGSRLPSVRQLAADLVLAPNTVVRAYRELELAGLLAIEGRKGAFVVGPLDSAQAPVEQAAARFAEDALRQGLSRAAVLRALSRALDAAGIA